MSQQNFPVIVTEMAKGTWGDRGKMNRWQFWRVSAPELWQFCQ